MLGPTGNVLFAIEYDKINFSENDLIIFEKNGKKAFFYYTQMRFIFKEKGF